MADFGGKGLIVNPIRAGGLNQPTFFSDGYFSRSQATSRSPALLGLRSKKHIASAQYRYLKYKKSARYASLVIGNKEFIATLPIKGESGSAKRQTTT